MGGNESRSQAQASVQVPQTIKEGLVKTFNIISGGSRLSSYGKMNGYLKSSEFTTRDPTTHPIEEEAIGKLCHLFQHGGVEGRKDELVQFSEQQFVKQAILLLGLGPSAQQHRILYGLQLTSNGKVTMETISATLSHYLKMLMNSAIFKSVFPQSEKWSHQEEDCMRLSSYETSSLPKDTVSLESFAEWLDKNSLVDRLYKAIFTLIFLHKSLDHSSLSELVGEKSGDKINHDTLLIPEVTIPTFLPSNSHFKSNLLDQSSLMSINNSLVHDLKGQLYPLFSSKLHGQSYSTLLGRILQRGPTLIVVQDKDGHVFGGFASQSWSIGPTFTGDSNCFLFALKPNLGVFTASGYNEHFMYMEQNAQTLPNGIGMGGQMEYFGLWISSDFGRGHSMARPKCTTYGSPTLSCKENFEIEQVEVWGAGKPPVPEDKVKEKSVLDSHREDKMILDLAGKTRHSEGLREDEESDDN